MAYDSVHKRLTKVLYKASSCPFLFAEVHCAGGDYCPFPEGKDKLCCFFCARFDICPDKTGVCTRLQDKK
ncbi:hypothetical protein LLG96_06515 [bacterium]|nr:hypothetical protein [bacterium]